MNRTILIATISLAFPLAGIAQPTARPTNQIPQISAEQASSLAKSARSTADYNQLAAFYRQQEAKFRAQATAEKVEMDRRAQVNASLYQKYPRPVDSAKYFYESFLSNANQAALQAQHYEQLAAAAQGKS
jgi:hypothetical protein